MNKVSLQYDIRPLKITDINQLHSFINSISEEKTFNYIQGQNFSIEQTKNFIKDQLIRMKENKSVHLIVTSKNSVIGSASIDLEEGVSSHEGALEISILKKYRNQGIGSILIEQLMKMAANEISNLKIITASVFENNEIAIKFYQRFGFEEFGRLPQGIFSSNKYLDKIYLYKKV